MSKDQKEITFFLLLFSGFSQSHKYDFTAKIYLFLSIMPRYFRSPKQVPPETLHLSSFGAQK